MTDSLPDLNTGGGIDLYYSLLDVLKFTSSSSKGLGVKIAGVKVDDRSCGSVFLKPSVVLLLSLAMDDGEFTIIMI